MDKKCTALRFEVKLPNKKLHKGIIMKKSKKKETKSRKNLKFDAKYRKNMLTRREKIKLGKKWIWIEAMTSM